LERFCRNGDELFRLSSALSPSTAAAPSTFECEFDEHAYADFAAFLLDTWSLEGG
jgi:hypothetical protein